MSCRHPSFPPLPRYLYNLEYIGVQEDQINEFKHITDPSSVVYKYVAAFLNSCGGRLWIGVSDDGIAFGVKDPSVDIANVKLAVENAVKIMFPPISHDLVRLTTIPIVTNRSKSLAFTNKGEPTILESMLLENWVIVIEVDKGPLPFYYTRPEGHVYCKYGAEALKTPQAELNRVNDDLLIDYMRKQISERNRIECENQLPT